MTTTLTQVIENAKQRGLLVSSQNTISDADFVRWANDELNQNIVPFINKQNEEYFIVEEEFTLEPGQSTLKVPARALGGSLRSITAEWNNTRFHLKSITREEREIYAHAGGLSYYLQGNTIVLVPAQTKPVSLTIAYARRPNKMVPIIQAKQVTAVNYQANQVTLTSSAPFITTAQKFDITSTDYPNELSLQSGQAVSIAQNKVTFQDASKVQPGDWLAVAGTTPLVPIQEELIPLLEERIALRAFQSLGDDNAVNITLNSIASMEAAMAMLIENRVVADPVILVNHNSPFRAGQRYRN